MRSGRKRTGEGRDTFEDGPWTAVDRRADWFIGRGWPWSFHARGRGTGGTTIVAEFRRPACRRPTRRRAALWIDPGRHPEQVLTGARELVALPDLVSRPAWP